MRGFSTKIVAMIGFLGLAGCPSVDPALDGTDGTDRQQGVDGADGSVGPQGPPGPQGPAGPAGPPGEPAPIPVPGPSPVGIWSVTSGALFDFREDKAKFVEFRADGSATIHRENIFTQSALCVPTTFGDSENALSMQFFQSSSEIVAPYTMTDQDHLQLRGIVDSAELTRAAEIPAALRCDELTIVNRVGLTAAPTSISGLVFQATPPGGAPPALWYTDSTQVTAHQLNPDTGAEISAIALNSGGRLVHAAQGESLWGHCFCGNSDATRVPTSGGAALDVVPAFTLTGARPEMLAYDEVANELWTLGRKNNSSQFEISRFKSDEEPDRLIDSRPFQRLQAMSFDGGRLWGINLLGEVVEFDPATAKALRTYNNPDRHVFWTGLAVRGDRIFLSGSENNVGVLLEVRR